MQPELKKTLMQPELKETLEETFKKAQTQVRKEFLNLKSELEATIKEVLMNNEGFLELLLKAIDIEIKALKPWQIRRRLKLMKHRRFFRQKLKQTKRQK